jgi:hypothetical protein
MMVPLAGRDGIDSSECAAKSQEFHPMCIASKAVWRERLGMFTTGPGDSDVAGHQRKDSTAIYVEDSLTRSRA